MSLSKTFYLCSDCSKDIYLKNYVQLNSKIKHHCTICLQDKPSIDISSDSLLRSFCRFLIRYHFPEYEYNIHFGGNELPELFYTDNPIITNFFSNIENRAEEIELFLIDLFDLNNYNSAIRLYFGKDGNTRLAYTEAIKNEKSDAWKQYKKQLFKENFFLLESAAKKAFKNIIDDFKCELKSGQKYFRARIGYKESFEKMNITKVKIKKAYTGKDLSSPPILKAKAGRANRQGVSYLYLASDKDTAIGELRPHPGHFVSYGEFLAKTDLLFADFRFINLVNYFSNEEKLEMFKLLKDLSEELTIPVLPEEQGNYLVTQFISDIIRQLGFDGILFKSSVSGGYNLVGFNSDKFSYKANSSELIKIISVNFEYKKTGYYKDTFLERVIEN